MSSATDPAATQAIISALLADMAPIFIGFTIATALFGVTALQFYLYFQWYPMDKLTTKALVLVVGTLDTFATILVAHSLYTFLIINAQNPLADNIIPWSFSVENGIVATITVIVQCYFAVQIYKVNGKHFIVGFIILVSLAAYSLELETVSALFKDPEISSLADHKVVVIGATTQGLDALCDILISITLCYYLRIHREGSARLREMLNRMMIYAVNRGLLTSVCQIMFLSLNVGFPDNDYWQPFHQIVGKLYINSLLANLNIRDHLNAQGSDVEYSLNDMKFRTNDLPNSSSVATSGVPHNGDDIVVHLQPRSSLLTQGYLSSGERNATSTVLQADKDTESV